MKKLLFGMAFMGFMMFVGVSVQAQELELRWNQMPCTDGSGGQYEICFYTGDGSLCSTWGEKTRECDISID